MNFGVDMEMAARLGQTVEKTATEVIVRDSDGVELIRFPHATSYKVRPDGTVYGNCGASYFDVYRTSGLGYRIQTGFALYAPRVAWNVEWETYTFETTVAGQVGQLETTEGGPITPSDSYEKIYYSDVNTYGTTVTGRVTFGRAWIVGSAYCDTGHPTDSVSI